ncbi:MAG TPA: arylsulfatase [Candidatus Paceibacterota bacterium]|nr:arylsulfatase [Verrucomicrobiota bacterium]HRY51462.1 arylsulfatase [Candidatus Paceibacterota bacterium]HRZ99333.1 arylsulfatase [Candidatus Paceibacterota bacterium]
MRRSILIPGMMFLLLSCSLPAKPSPLRPNILFILADDLGYGDLGCYGQKRIRTPHLDQMAREGMRFTQAYAGSTVCAPSRCVLMTGLHTGHCRVRGNGGATPLAQVLRPNDLTVARLLQQTGYRTALIGKWGLGDVGTSQVGLPTRQGFHEFFGYLNQSHAHNYYPSYLWRNETKVNLRNVVPNERPNGTGVASQRVDYSHDLVASEAIQFIRRQDKTPFFLYLAFTIPHANNEAGKSGMEIPNLYPYENTDWPAPQKGHAAMITRMDHDIGRILETLKEMDLDRNTLVIFTSDNGPHREGGNNPDFNDSNGPFRGIKRDLYEGGIRVPFIARWPGTVPANSLNRQPIWFADFLPTAAALAKTSAPVRTDGVNLVPTLRNPSRAPRRSQPFYWEFHEGNFQQALLKDRWKIIRRAKDKTVELYDLGQDPGETKNLAPSYLRLVKNLEERLDRSRTETPDWPTQKGQL